MASKVDLYLKRARTEINIATLLLKTSGNKMLNDFDISEDETFYSGVISHCNYSIFYSAKAMLLTKSIETKAPEIHKKTIDAFKETFIDTGILDMKLLMIYKKMIVQADSLLEIFRTEKRKRGDFTYNTISLANLEPARESMENARIFYKHCNAFLMQA